MLLPPPIFIFRISLMREENDTDFDLRYNLFSR